MSILGYSTSYFLPDYWANTPLYGEKIIPLLDYLLSMDYEESEGLAQAYYDIISKYKNQSDLPIDVVEEIINENGYSYVKELLGNDENSLRLLLTLMVLIHQLKGSKTGIEVVLSLLKRDNSIVSLQTIGNPRIDKYKNISNFSLSDYVILKDFSIEKNPFELNLEISGFNLLEDQCIMSIADYGLYIGVDTSGHLVLSLGSDRESWNILNSIKSTRTLSQGTSYFLRLQGDIFGYALQVSTDGKSYETWIGEESKEPLSIYKGTVYLGVNFSTGELSSPFSGVINYSNFSISTTDTEITQWFEQTPVKDENTFIIKSEMDVALVSTAFFKNFSNFVKKYVYPTLEAFEANLTFNNSMTFLPYVREKITYVAQNEIEYVPFKVKGTEDEDVSFLVEGVGENEEFKVWFV